MEVMVFPMPLVVPGPSLLPQNIPLALTLMIASSLLFALGVTIQHYAVGRTVDTAADSRHLGLRQVLGLLTNPRWLGGIAVAAGGSAFHILGLMMAPVTVVQPVGILAVPWSVLLAARIHHYRPTRRTWAAVCLTIAGIASFTLISTRNAAPDTALPPWGILIGSVVVFAVAAGFGLLGRFGRHSLRCIMWASGGSFCYGLSSALIKALSEMVSQPGVFGRPLIWGVLAGMLACYAFGGWMIQQSYANGPAEIVVGSMTTTDPIVAVAFGIVVLGEGALIGALDGLGMALSGAVAVTGVVILSKLHPASQRDQVPAVS